MEKLQRVLVNGCMWIFNPANMYLEHAAGEKAMDSVGMCSAVLHNGVRTSLKMEEGFHTGCGCTCIRGILQCMHIINTYTTTVHVDIRARTSTNGCK